MADENKRITIKKEDDMSEWYNQIMQLAELAEFSDVKGCMIIKPNGYELWESIQGYLDPVIKSKGVRNAYFPLFIPEHYFHLEAKHAEGFSPEVAWVTHSGDNLLEEKLAIRPTSETIICKSFSKWVRSHRDLPMLLNQWCNVVRWETKATRPFLRSREFLWQEGHCLFETDEENLKFLMEMLDEYEKMCKELLAIPVLKGRKTESEKFAGAQDTYTVEAFMPDGKGLQMGTSHHLGQGFSKAFDIKFLGKDGKEHTPYYQSWGISTRMIGGIIMVHSDNKGLVIPPRMAVKKAVIVPILFEDTKEKVLEKCKELKEKLNFDVIVDDREDYSAGWKFNNWEMKGMPIRIELGPKDIEKNQVVLVRRDVGEKKFVAIDELNDVIKKELEDMHNSLYDKAKKFLDSSIVEVKGMEALTKAINEKKIAKTGFCGEGECEDWIKDKTGGATSRCIDLNEEASGNCVHCEKQAKHVVYFSKSY